MENEHVINDVRNVLISMGLKPNREKFYLEEAGHRGFAVDVGSSHGEVLIRITDEGVQVERIPILTRRTPLSVVNQFEKAMDTISLLVAAKKAEVNA